MSRSIEAVDVQRISFILLRLLERDGEPITITRQGEPIAILMPSQEQDTRAAEG